MHVFVDVSAAQCMFLCGFFVSLCHALSLSMVLLAIYSLSIASSVETNEEDEDMLRALAASMEGMKDSNIMASDNKDATIGEKEEESCSSKKPTYPPLPEEPKGDRSILCRVGLRLPDGRRVQRNFLKSDPIQVRKLILLVLIFFCPVLTFV